MLEKIQEIIEKEVNPYLQMHQGSAEVLEFNEDGILTLRLFGGCSGCPSSAITLFNGIVPILKEHCPEIKEVILG